jgi:hypothetical protein
MEGIEFTVTLIFFKKGKKWRSGSEREIVGSKSERTKSLANDNLTTFVRKPLLFHQNHHRDPISGFT